MITRLSIAICALMLAAMPIRAADDSELAVPTPLGAAQLFEHWQFRLDAAGRPNHWLRSAEQNRAAKISLPIEIDRHGPDMQLRWQPDPVTAADSAIGVLGPKHRPLLQSADPAGVADAQILSRDGQPVALDRWSEDLEEGRFSLQLLASDRLGNVQRTSAGPFLLDRTPPTLSWRRLDPAEGLPHDVYNGKHALIELSVTDAGAGLESVQLNGSSAEDIRGKQRHTTQFEFSDGQVELTWLASDRVGNRSQGRLQLRVDQHGPELQIASAGQTIDLKAARLPPNQALRLTAVDDTAGVESACVVASIWGEQCRPLPLDVVGLSWGRFTLEFRARDRLANISNRRFVIEVTP
ncbi:hypothetical protein [Pseudomarimonas arenosa]|uniref:Ig-like domain-containing protein n=1 Tax=Pseudomarimonas arenosa TaxID=2774145 RepID=A0AAW3ZKT6_9GAMM|nr:hypothetical protein [Pseudomarimonas arenosa]MBD8525535.1 hypothetical protein [Pseudomarimonas arenosa]